VDRAIKDLERTPFSSFDNSHKESIAKLFRKEAKHLDRIIKIAGFLQMEAELMAIDSNLLKIKEHKQAWNLALVRTGNKEKKEILLRNIQKMTLDDHFTYEVVPTLVYVRQKEIMDHLLDGIMEPGNTCNPPDLDTRGSVSCAYNIIEQIAPYIKNFPTKVDRYGIQTDDFPAMLSEVRSWFTANKDIYVLDGERY